MPSKTSKIQKFLEKADSLITQDQDGRWLVDGSKGTYISKSRARVGALVELLLEVQEFADQMNDASRADALQAGEWRDAYKKMRSNFELAKIEIGKRETEINQLKSHVEDAKAQYWINPEDEKSLIGNYGFVVNTENKEQAKELYETLAHISGWYYQSAARANENACKLYYARKELHEAHLDRKKQRLEKEKALKELESIKKQFEVNAIADKKEISDGNYGTVDDISKSIFVGKNGQ